MKKPIVKCPKCGGTNTREWSIGTTINVPDYISGTHMFSDEFYKTLKEEFGNQADIDDYYCAENICDDCNCHFATKNFIEVKVTEAIVFEKYSNK